MRARNLGSLLLSAAAIALFAVSAQATPITYTFTSGQVTITATVAGNPVAGPVTVPLTGTSVRVDEGALTLDRIDLAIGSTMSIPVSPTYLGFNAVHIDFATLTALNGTLSLFDPGPPAGYNYSIGPVNVAGQFDATNVVPANNINNAPFGVVNPSASGTLFVDTNVALALDGITIGSIDPDGPGGAPPLVLKGDFTFEGTVPEPGTVVLLGLGLAAVAARRRS
jgi:hypothetical protein